MIARTCAKRRRGLRETRACRAQKSCARSTGSSSPRARSSACGRARTTTTQRRSSTWWTCRTHTTTTTTRPSKTCSMRRTGPWRRSGGSGATCCAASTSKPTKRGPRCTLCPRWTSGGSRPTTGRMQKWCAPCSRRRASSCSGPRARLSTASTPTSSTSSPSSCPCMAPPRPATWNPRPRTACSRRCSSMWGAAIVCSPRSTCWARRTSTPTWR
mmetsp:Transcript_16919/g.52178  ORF Transcript_16919/g.52178 Transcript_16919/m.52178 type:complete len:214 (-) Transcript_16919:846-1487(-)